MGEVDLNIKVTGYQWKWEYEYLGEDVSFFSTLARESNAARQLGSGVHRHPQGQGSQGRRGQAADRGVT